MVNLSAGDLGLEIDYNEDRPGDVLQRWSRDSGAWIDYQPDGEQITCPFDVDGLGPGKYRLRSK